jgi:cobalt/nickel transport system permease protein
MHFDSFSEPYLENNGFIRSIDSRAKLIFVSACLLLSVGSNNPSASFTVGAVCLALIAASGAPLTAVTLRMSEPLMFAAILAAVQAFLSRGAALYSFHILGVVFSVSADGLHRGIFIISRVFGAVTAVLFLTMTTPANRLLSAAVRLKAPKSMVEVALFAYRYIFVLIEDAITVYHSQKGRLGYSGFGRGVKSLGVLAGSVFLRAYAQAEATGQAMSMRGYTGEYIPVYRERLRVSDAALLCLMLAPCLAAYLWTL